MAHPRLHGLVDRCASSNRQNDEKQGVRISRHWQPKPFSRREAHLSWAYFVAYCYERVLLRVPRFIHDYRKGYRISEDLIEEIYN